jgi:DNA-binding transcriptional LysR family regulator
MGIDRYREGMNLQQLRYLVAVADTGSVSGAARLEQVSQPVVSRALRALASDCGVQLFAKDGRGLVLTEDGAAVVVAARRALQAIEDVRRTAHLLAARTDLTVVATPNNSALLSPIVADFLKVRPAVPLRLLRAADMREVAAMVASGEAQLGFGDLPTPSAADEVLRSTPIWQAQVVLVSPPGLRLPARVPRTRLSELPLVLPPSGTARRADIEGMVSEARGRLPQAALSTDERSAWISSAQRGIASFLTYEAVGVELEGVKLRPLRPPLHSVVGFLHTDRPPDSAQALIRLAQQCQPPAGCLPTEGLLPAAASTTSTWD